MRDRARRAGVTEQALDLLFYDQLRYALTLKSRHAIPSLTNYLHVQTHVSCFTRHDEPFFVAEVRFARGTAVTLFHSSQSNVS